MKLNMPGNWLFFSHLFCEYLSSQISSCFTRRDSRVRIWKLFVKNFTQDLKIDSLHSYANLFLKNVIYICWEKRWGYLGVSLWQSGGLFFLVSSLRRLKHGCNCEWNLTQMLKTWELIEYIKYEPVLTSNGWAILIFSEGRAKGDIKLDITTHFCKDFQYVVTVFNYKLNRDAETHSN